MYSKLREEDVKLTYIIYKIIPHPPGTLNDEFSHLNIYR